MGEFHDMKGGRLKALFAFDTRTLASLRIGLATMILSDLALRACDLTAHYSDAGVLPRAALVAQMPNRWWVSLHLANGTVLFQAALFLLAACCAVALLLGYRTRAATITSWLLLVSLHARNPFILQESDTVLRLLMFWAMFLPLGTRWSLDRKAGRTRLAENQHVSVASAAILLQLSMLYLFSIVLKSDPAWRSDFTAVYYALSQDELTTSIGLFLRDFPMVMKVSTALTLLLELAAPLLVFSPWGTDRLRVGMVVVMSALHLGMGLTMHLGLFAPLMCVAWSMFLPGSFWDKLADKYAFARALPPPRFPFPEGSRPTRWVSSLLAAAALVYVFLWNVRTVDRDVVGSIPRSAHAVGSFFHLGQRWSMFAPKPHQADGWYVIDAQLLDGDKVDLFRGGAPLSWDKPAQVSSLYKNYRWRLHASRLREPAVNDIVLPSYARYLCQQWNGTHLGPERLDHFTIYFMQEWTLPPTPAQPAGGTAPIEKQTLWRDYCFDLPDGWDGRGKP